MNTDKIINGVLGDKPSNPLSALAKDTDKDTFVNPIDCKPLNPNKDGFWQNMKDKVKAKVETIQKERAESKAVESKIREEAKVKAQKAYVEERTRVIEKSEIAKAKARANAPAFGGLGQLLSTKRLKDDGRQAKKVVSYKKTTKYVKSGAGYKPVTTYKKVTHTVKPKTTKPKAMGFKAPDMNSFLMGSNKGKNKGSNIYNLKI